MDARAVGRGTRVRRIAALALGALSAPLLVAPPALAAPQVNGSFSVPGLTDSSQIVQGPDGNMWATTPDATDDDVARINSQTGAVSKYDFTDADLDSPVGITRQGNNLWVTATNRVGRFTPANPVGAVETTINEIGSARGITLGPDGNLWAVSDGNVVKIPPGAPGTYTNFNTLITQARQVTPGAGNTLWATGGTQVIHFTTAGTQAVDSPYTFGGGPQGIAAGPGGQVAFGNPVNSPQQIGRITPPGAPQLTNLGALDAGFGVVFGNDGAYWLGQYNGNNLRRFTPQGQSTFLGGFPAAPNRGPRYLAKGPNNTLWVNLDVPGQADPDRVARVTGVTSPPPPSPPTPEPSNEFSFGKVKKNKKKGTAKLTVIVPGPGDLELAKTKKVKGAEKNAAAAGEVKLKVKPKRKTKKKLEQKGKAKVRADVTYTPTGGEANTESKKLKLVKRG
jgi:hypothetical protein